MDTFDFDRMFRAIQRAAKTTDLFTFQDVNENGGYDVKNSCVNIHRNKFQLFDLTIDKLSGLLSYIGSNANVAKRIKTLSINNCNISESNCNDIIRVCKHLETINLRDCTVSVASIIEIIDGCKKLKTCNVFDCANITNNEFAQILKQFQIAQLTIHYETYETFGNRCHFTNASSEIIKHDNKKLNLSFSATNQLMTNYDDILAHINRSQTLKILEVTLNEHVNFDIAKSIIEKCPMLTELKLNRHFLLNTAADISDIMRNCRHLENLEYE